MKNFQDLLKELNACSLARKWAGDRNNEQVVADCHRGDWLLWLAARIEVDNRKLVLAAGKCAETVIHLMIDERSRAAVRAAIDYGEGKISKDELDAAARAATYAADAANAAASAAAYHATTAAADTAVYAAAYTARDAAYAAAAARAAARAAAYAENQRQTAEIVRQVLGGEIIEKVKVKLHD